MGRDVVPGSLVAGRLPCAFGVFTAIKLVLDNGALAVVAFAALPSSCREVNVFCGVDMFCRVDVPCRGVVFCGVDASGRGVETSCGGVDVMVVNVVCAMSCKSS